MKNDSNKVYSNIFHGISILNRSIFVLNRRISGVLNAYKQLKPQISYLIRRLFDLKWSLYEKCWRTIR